jgi:hypothetical protein
MRPATPLRHLAQLSLAILLTSPLHAACPDPDATLSAACPELYAELDRQGLVTALDLAPDARSDPQTVSQLKAYLTAARAPHAAAATLDARKLDDIIANNYRAAQRKEPSFLERLANWWSSLWGEQENSGVDVYFWRRFIPAETFARALFYGLSGLLIALLLVYGWRELQPFLHLRRDEASAGKARSRQRPAAWPPALTGLATRAAIAKVYASLVAHLTERKRLPDIVGLTHAELAQAFSGTLTTAERAQAFRTISNTAAQTLFTEQSVSPADLAQFLATANTLAEATTTTHGTPNA